MDKDQFWRLIEDAKAKSDGECKEEVELIKTALAKFPLNEIVAFGRILDELKEESYRWDLWGAAYLLNGGASEDGFEYFRCWLIAQGQAVYEGSLQDPDSLANIIETGFAEAECESLLYVADRAYEKTTGNEIDIGRPDPSLIGIEPVGVKWEENELNALLPRISAKINM